MMSDLFSNTLEPQDKPQWVGYVGACVSGNKNALSLNPYQKDFRRGAKLEHEISATAYVALDNDMPKETLHRLLTHKADELREILRSKRSEDGHSHGEVSIHNDHIEIRRRKHYGSQEAAESTGQPIIDAWRDYIQNTLFRDQQISISPDNPAFTELRVTPRNTKRLENGEWNSTLIIYAQHGSTEAQHQRLYDATQTLQTQLAPNLHDTRITYDKDDACIEISITRESVSQLETYRGDILRLIGGKGTNFGGHSRALPPPHIVERMRSRGHDEKAV